MMRSLQQFFFGTFRGRLIVGVSLVQAAMMALFILDLTVRQRAMLLDRQVEEAVALAQSLSTSTAGWIASADVSGLQEMVEAQRRYPELLFAMITDDDGLVLAHTDLARRGLYLIDLPDEARQTMLCETPGLVDVAVPAMLGGRHVGWVRIGIGQREAARKLSEITLDGIRYALVTMLISSVIVWLMGCRITQRLYAVQETINMVRSGNRQARSHVSGTDEAAVMAGEFNAMLDALEKRDAKLRASEEKLRGLAEIVKSSDDAIMGKTLDGRILSWNKGAEQIYGYAAEEIVGQPVDLLVPPDRKEELEAIMEKVGRGEGVEHFETTRVRKDGKTIHVALTISPIRDAGGQIAGASTIARDITGRRQAEEEIRKLNTELEQRVRNRTMQLEEANRELESFSYSVSHDLRAPLRAIDGFSRMVLEDCADRIGEEGRDCLERVRAASRRMGQLIDDLLQLSRLTRSEMRRTPVDLSAMVRSLADELQKGEPERRVEFVIEPGVVAAADPNLMRIALVNLLGNAWKFTGKQDAAKIEFGHTIRGDGTVFFVRDNGVGFNMAYAGKLFGAFQRLHSPAEFPGNGIGLATVQRVIHRHNGRVWAESQPGQGAVFYFTLPTEPREP